MASDRRRVIARLLLSSALLAVPAAHAGADCMFQAPKTVAVNEAFTLCGPAGAGYLYEWRGPGFTSRNRCLTVPGLQPGAYEFALTTRWNQGSPERCATAITVGSGAGGSMTCEITGPRAIPAGATATLCAPESHLHAYRWTGPGGFSATSRCVEVGAQGRYQVTIRNIITGYTRECTQWLDAGGPGEAACAITGPTTVAAGSSARLCGPGGSRSWRWTGPGGFSSSARCVRAARAGDYTLVSAERVSGRVARCTYHLEAARVAACEIDGPVRMADGGRVRLCAKAYANADYDWHGPRGFRSLARCVTANREGLYRVTVRDRSTGHRLTCEHRLDAGLAGGVDEGAPATLATLPARVALGRLPTYR